MRGHQYEDFACTLNYTHTVTHFDNYSPLNPYCMRVTCDHQLTDQSVGSGSKLTDKSVGGGNVCYWPTVWHGDGAM